MISLLVSILVILIVMAKIEFWMYKHLVDEAISRGHNVTLGIFGPATLND